MWVIATKPGFYNRLYEPGELFEIPDKEMFSENWMKRSRKPRAAKPDEAVAEPDAPREPEEPAADEGE